jgi:ribosomal protein S27E
MIVFNLYEDQAGLQNEDPDLYETSGFWLSRPVLMDEWGAETLGMEDSTFYIKVCPKCGNNIQIGLGQASKLSKIRCNECGYVLDLKKDKDKIEAIRKNLGEIEKDIKRYHE